MYIHTSKYSKIYNSTVPYVTFDEDTSAFIASQARYHILEDLLCIQINLCKPTRLQKYQALLKSSVVFVNMKDK